MHGSFRKLVNMTFKRLALLQIATGSFVINAHLLDSCVKNEQNHLSGLELLVKALYVSRRVEKTTTNPRKRQKSLKQNKKTNPKELSKQLFTKSPFQKSHSTLFHFTSPILQSWLAWFLLAVNASHLPSAFSWASPSPASGFQVPSMFHLIWSWLPAVRTEPEPVHISCSQWNRQTCLFASAVN